MNMKSDDFIYLYKIELKPSQQQIGDTCFRSDGEAVTEFKSLCIFKYKDDTGVYLMYEFGNGKGTDSYHESIDDAFKEAKDEFGIEKTDWKKIEKEQQGKAPF